MRAHGTSLFLVCRHLMMVNGARSRPTAAPPLGATLVVQVIKRRVSRGRLEAHTRHLNMALVYVTSMHQYCARAGKLLRPVMYPELEDSDQLWSLINTLLLVSVLLYGFSMQMAFGTWGHEDLVEADARNVAIRGEAFRNYPAAAYPYPWDALPSHLLISMAYLDAGLKAISYFFLATLIGIISSVLLSCIRQDSVRLFHAIFRWVIYLGYLFVAIGMAYFMRLCHLCIELFYPRYDVRTSAEDVREYMDEVHSVQTRAEIIDRVFDNSTMSMIELSTYGHGLGLFNLLSTWYLTEQTTDIIWSLSWFAVGLLLYFILSCCKRRCKRPSRDDTQRKSPVSETLRRAGCPEHEAKFKQAKVNSWTGIQRDDLINRLGIPLGDAIRIWELISYGKASQPPAYALSTMLGDPSATKMTEPRL